MENLFDTPRGSPRRHRYRGRERRSEPCAWRNAAAETAGIDAAITLDSSDTDLAAAADSESDSDPDDVTLKFGR